MQQVRRRLPLNLRTCPPVEPSGSKESGSAIRGHCSDTNRTGYALLDEPASG